MVLGVLLACRWPRTIWLFSSNINITGCLLFPWNRVCKPGDERVCVCVWRASETPHPLSSLSMHRVQIFSRSSRPITSQGHTVAVWLARWWLFVVRLFAEKTTSKIQWASEAACDGRSAVHIISWWLLNKESRPSATVYTIYCCFLLQKPTHFRCLECFCTCSCLLLFTFCFFSTSLVGCRIRPFFLTPNKSANKRAPSHGSVDLDLASTNSTRGGKTITLLNLRGWDSLKPLEGRIAPHRALLFQPFVVLVLFI